MSEFANNCRNNCIRVAQLTADYKAALEKRDHALAAIIKGELNAARAYAQGYADAYEFVGK